MSNRLRGCTRARCGALGPSAPAFIGARLASNLDYDPE
jgi:hypothetical protein